MFMLTHTYFLQKVLESVGLKDIEPDIYVYNIAPDLLAIHPLITPAQTHNLQRSFKIPDQYPKSTYVIYHLFIDDLSHFGYISSNFQEKIYLNSQGYSYKKGNQLVQSILDLYRTIEKEISFRDAVYQSHLIIEMTYDLVISNQINSFKTIDVLVEAIKYTAKNKMNEFLKTINWLYGLEDKKINEVMKKALFLITKESMEGLMNMEGRINLYIDKFGFKSNERLFYVGLKDLFQRAMDLIDDDELFFIETTKVMKNYKIFPFIK